MGDAIRRGNSDIECSSLLWLFGELGEDLGVTICLEGGDIEDDDFGLNLSSFTLIERSNSLVCSSSISVLAFDVVEKEDFGLSLLDVLKSNGMSGELEVETRVSLSSFGGVLRSPSVGKTGCTITVG